MSKEIYVVMKSVGQYEDRFETQEKAFSSKEKADSYIKQHRDYYDELSKKYDNIEINVDDKKEEAFHLYLKETNTQLYDVIMKAINNNDYYNSQDNENWDAYYEIRDAYEDNKKLVSEYLHKIGLTDSELEQIKVYDEYQNTYYDGLPYYYSFSVNLEE